MANRLDALMSASHQNTVGTGDPVDLAALTDDVTATSGEFSEPFWDLEKYRDDGQPFDIEGSPIYGDTAWDRVQLGQYQLPGIWTASGTPGLRLDVQKPLGFDGAAVITRGYLPASITLTGLLWTPKQFGLLKDIIPAIWRRPNKIAAQDVQLGKKGKITAAEADQGEIVVEQQSLPVLTPALNVLGIFALVIRQITPLVPHAIPGVRQMTIDCVEYVPEPAKKPSAVRKVKGEAPARGENAFDREIKAKDARAPHAPSTRAAALEPGKAGE